ncbi:MAG: hypothetical protein ABIQ89_01845 [Candidatus Saccharimonadales bacterium]
MQTYIVIYESATKAKDLENHIKSTYGTYSQITETSWVVVTDKTAVQIREGIIAVKASGDRIFVIRSGAVGAWINTRGTGDWLKKYL